MLWNISYSGKSCKKIKFVGPSFLTCHCPVNSYHFASFFFFFFLLSFFFRQLHHQRPFFSFFFFSSSEPLHRQRFLFSLSSCWFFLSFFLFSFFLFLFLSFFLLQTHSTMFTDQTHKHKPTSINPQPWLRTGFLLH